ncbi:hypothetical protein CsSME_00027304 [Camellia sinensis var. sinensis]
MKILTSQVEPINNLIHLDYQGCLYPVWVCEDAKLNHNDQGCSLSIQRTTESGKGIINEDRSSKNYRGRKEEEDDVVGAEGDLACHDGALHSDKELACKERGMVDIGNDYLSISAVSETCSLVGNRDE